MGNDDLFDLKIVTYDGLPVTSFNGIKIIPHCGTEDITSPNIIFIPVIFGDLKPILSNRKTVEWLKDQNMKGALMMLFVPVFFWQLKQVY
jgi:transcriptional regulator GlxA family with amidase domain